MLELRNIVKKYGDRYIYDHAQFKAYENELTIAMGKSGSGKSTLHNIITLHDKCECEYFYNDQDIYKLSDKDKNKLLQDHFGIVNQVPAFINDLTVKQHIELCQSLNEGYDVEEYIHDLCLDEILNHYPPQLSGGEKMRVAVLLALVHQPDILVFDEPTSSLDRHHSEIIVEMMKKYAHAGHISIIFTHDSLMRDVADRLYYIENQQLTMTFFNHADDVKKSELKHIRKRKNTYFLIRMYRHKFTFKILTLSITALMIAIASFSIFHGNSTIQFYKDKLKEIEKVGVAFKEGQKPGPWDSGIPMSEVDLLEINNIQNIKEIWPYITTFNPHIIYGDSFQNDYKIYQNGKLIHSVSWTDSDPMMEIGTYNEDYKYDLQLDKTFDNSDGVYMDGYFLCELFYRDEFKNKYDNGYTHKLKEKLYEVIEQIDENTEIELPISIPVYIEIGENGLSYPYYIQTKVKKKIKGIYTNLQCNNAISFGYINGYYNAFMPLHEMLSLMEENKEEDVEIDGTYFMSFSPVYYHFTIQDGVSFKEVKKEIESKGLKVLSYYADAEDRVEIIKELNSGLKMIAIIVSLVTLFILFGTKYNQKDEYRNDMQFFIDKGYSYKYAKNKLVLKFISHAFMSSLVAFVLFIYMVYWANNHYNITTHVNIFFAIFVVGMALCVEVGLPLLVVRGGKSHD